ncbi:hypothetical protein [Thalassobacillus sp. CUG 92003]|uniref:TcaA NTF2-like domain-containing protein n=1 Tax=Thalassobacillus sp. CUG 92003 TaxID=2736641 RepID=UPI0015E7270D|nr:hypothetical protein [Thalassobacillus sp. CUG 92003]
MLQFIQDSVDALNQDDFSIVLDHFGSNGGAKNEYSSYLENIKDRVEHEDFFGGELLDLEDHGDYLEVTMLENYGIEYTDGEVKDVQNRAVYKVTRSNGDFKVNEYLNIEQQ